MKDGIFYEDVPIDILDLQFQTLKNKEISSIKVLWRTRSVEGATYEAIAVMQAKYPHLFPYDSTPA